MSDKPIAVILASIGVVSLCAVCAFGPVVIGSAVGGTLRWFTGFGDMAAIGLAIFATLVVYVLFRRWGAVNPRKKSKLAVLTNFTEQKNR